MYKRLLMVMLASISAVLLSGCTIGHITIRPIETEEAGGSDISEQDETEEEEECFVYFDDGEYIEYQVPGAGKEFVLPESFAQDAEGDFAGWLGHYGLYQPGDVVIAEEFMNFTALRTQADAGTVVTIDTVKGGCAYCSSEEEMILDSPYLSYAETEADSFFDYWTDEEGNVYEAGSFVKVENGELLILTAVYSTDFSNAYKVDVYYNTGDPENDLEYHRYIKKGASIMMEAEMYPVGAELDGWYDAPEGGNLIAEEYDMLTPESDISVYAHWNRE